MMKFERKTKRKKTAMRSKPQGHIHTVTINTRTTALTLPVLPIVKITWELGGVGGGVGMGEGSSKSFQTEHALMTYTT